MQKHCQIPTPDSYVKAMLNIAGYTENLYGKTVLENSCGEGRILVEIVRRYIDSCRKDNYSDEEIKRGIQRDITAYEIDLKCVEKCVNELDKLALKMHLKDVKWNIKSLDYLKSAEEQYDYIIGNPPYITYHLLSEEERVHLKENFESCSKGRFDYCYAFIEKSIKSLKQQGVLTYLIPYSVFRNRFADKIRAMMKEDLVSIIDYSGVNVFGNVTASIAVIHLIKGSQKANLVYRKTSDEKQEIVQKNRLTNKWFFTECKPGKRFGDYFTIQNSVATLCNSAFLISEYEEDNGYIIVDGKKLEKELIRDAVSTKSCKKKERKDKIIFPYINRNGKYERIPEAYMREKFPGIMGYLQKFIKNLKHRKSSEGVQWYEYGRTQALSEIDGEKLILSMVFTTRVTVYKVGAESVPYAGYFIKTKENNNYTLDFAKQLLEMPEFYEYVKNVGTPTTETSIRISVKEIENYTYADASKHT